jgi:hypothetical protein
VPGCIPGDSISGRAIRLSLAPVIWQTHSIFLGEIHA